MGERRASIDDLGEANPLGVGDPLLEVGERLAVIQIGRVDRMTGFSKQLSELEEPRGLSLRMMEKQNPCHRLTVADAVSLTNVFGCSRQLRSDEFRSVQQSILSTARHAVERVVHMAIDHVLAVVPVADIETARGWYERLLGREADNRPMDSLAECGPYPIL